MSLEPASALASPPQDTAELRRLAISARKLTKAFPDRRRGLVEAVKEVSFTCRYGEIFGLLGPNGAGKTTTLRMLATILQPTSGQASIAGWDVARQPLEVRRSIGYLSANTGLYQRLTARETLEYFGRLHGLPEETLAARVEEMLDLFDMRSFADVRCEKLSTGMRQKVSIARTMVHDPPVLILDEPTLGLDILIASTMIQFIRDCRERGKCIIFSTHIMSEVEKLCDRIGIIHNGKVRAIGTLEELRRQTGCQFLEDIFMALLTGSGPGAAALRWRT
ncbi:MAG: ATP-binding cassette domain-containing protein [Planctomycetes bacterium]|nr:ATP-binding cassette domain-containing protein [Planctomycetota bacterium]